MPELTNLLRQKLASIAEPEVHPEADILAAYTEQLLAARERKDVLEHLAVCGQCREVIFLLSATQPATADGETTDTPLRQPKPSWGGFSWRSWKSAWGLAASLAGLAVVTTLIVEMPRKQVSNEAVKPTPVLSPSSAPAAPLSNEPMSNEPTTAESASRSTPGTTDLSALAGEVRTTNSSRAESASIPRMVAKSAPVTVVGGPYVNVEMFANDANYVVPLVDLPPAPTPRITSQKESTLPLSSPALGLAPAPYEISGVSPLRIVRPNPGTSRITTIITRIENGARRELLRGRLTPPISSTFADNTMGGRPGDFNPTKQPGTAEEANAPFLDIDGSNGADDLKHSGAFTRRALAGNSVNGAGAGLQSVWKVVDGKLLKLSESGSWIESAPAGEDIQFSVVKKWGSDIWAGGSSAGLVHSRDNGASWERITLGASATGTIDSIEASGLKIVVKSSSGQSWISADGGKSWALQD